MQYSQELHLHVSSVQFSHSVVSDSLQPPWIAACQASLSFIIFWSLLKLMSVELVMPSNHLILCRPLLLLPSILPSIRVSSNESVLCIRCQSTGASASVLPMSIQGWFPLGLTGLIFRSPRDSQESSPTHSSKASILWHLAFFMVQLSHPYMTAGKTVTFIIQIFVSKVMSLLFNTLSRFVIAFLPRSKCPLISWLQNHGCCCC